MTSPLDFLGIGAQKAGTTWLWQMLRGHPQVWLPPRKELHYFDRALTYPSPSFLATDHPLRRWLSRAPHDRECRVKCWRHVRRHVREGDWAALRWDLRYYFGTFDDRWYLSLFDQGAGRVRGEITPSYSILEASDVARIARLVPTLKIMFLLRNPVDRAWSQIRFDWTRGASQGIGNLEELRAFIESPMQALRSDYLRTLDIWGASFPRTQMHIDFYDDIALQPAEMLTRILTFLEIDSADLPVSSLSRKVHVSREMEMPTEVRRELARRYLPEIEKLATQVGGHVERWLSEMKAIV